MRNLSHGTELMRNASVNNRLKMWKKNKTAAGVQPNSKTFPGIRTGQDRVNVHGGTNKWLATSTPQSGDAFSRRPPFLTLFAAAPGNDEIPFNFSARVGINYLFSSV